MKESINRLLAYFFVVTLLQAPLVAQDLPSGDPAKLGFAVERLDQIDDLFEQYAANKDMAGSVILLARRGEVAYHKAFGQADIERGQAMGKDAIFRIASQTKALVSVGIMMLQEEGKLLIGDRLSKYIPEFESMRVAIPDGDGGYSTVPADRPITLRHLLTHSAGIGYGYGPGKEEWAAAEIQGWYFAHREEPVLETVRKMASLPIQAQPGTKFVYGYNTDILGAVIEVVSRMTLDEFLRARILEPLGMEDTHFYLPKSKSDRLATVYDPREDGSLVAAPVEGTMDSQGAYVDGPRISFSGGAGLLSTAKDYYLFLQMLANGGSLNGKRLVSRKTVELMIQDHLGDVAFPWAAGCGFGLGFRVIEDLGEFGQPGSEGTFSWGGAYSSTYWVDPKEELIVVYFTQLRPTARVPHQEKLRALIYSAMVE